MSSSSAPAGSSPCAAPAGAQGWPRRRPPRLPDRGGLHPVRVGKRVNVKQARALEGTLAQWMEAHIPRLTRVEIDEAFARGDVCDAWGAILDASTPARILEWPVYMYWAAADDTADLPHIPVVYRGDGWLVVNKPKGLATQPRGSYVARTVTVALRRQENNANLSPAHRLDRATSGLLLFTERPELRRPYQELFAQRKVRKVYRAVAVALPDTPIVGGSDEGVAVSVDPPEMPGWIKVESRIEKVERVMVSRIVPGEVNALTYLRATRERVSVRGREFTVYEVSPHHGRTHQIRLHFAALGAPLVGDPLYGGFNAAPYGEDQVPEGASPLHLEAVRLEFTDPQTGEDVCISLP
ncbi:pseudouridine synthase [Schaalia sp. Marseille-Q2122]|uniref:pseudouridine synthase n=1 Tax=Schaalia sp. Marseille-Q2122 TaxID=2736604 RepID=UPI00158AF183|nr:pseudouridine synthase [Schaalia sp. Marseille-Q2122]